MTIIERDRDSYGRLLRNVAVDGADVGEALIGISVTVTEILHRNHLSPKSPDGLQLPHIVLTRVISDGIGSGLDCRHRIAPFIRNL